MKSSTKLSRKSSFPRSQGAMVEVRPVAGSVVVPATETASPEKPKKKGFIKKLLTQD